MAEQTIEVTVTAVDMASNIMQRVSQITTQQTRAMEASGKAMETAALHSSKLERRWQELFSASEYLSKGLRKIGNIIEDFLWAGFIGMVSAVVGKIMSWALEAWNAQESTEGLTKSLQNQGREWGLLPDKIKGVTQTTVDLYNAQLQLAQFQERNRGTELRNQIQSLTQLNEGLEKSASGLERYQDSLDESTPASNKLLEDLRQRILQNKVAIAELNLHLEQNKKLMEMKPATLSNVKAHVEGPSTVENTWSEFSKEMEALNIAMQLHGDEVDVNSKLAEIYEKTLIKLQQNGLKPTSEGVRDIVVGLQAIKDAQGADMLQQLANDLDIAHKKVEETLKEIKQGGKLLRQKSTRWGMKNSCRNIDTHSQRRCFQ